MALEGSERKTLHAILHEPGADPAGYLSDTLIARATHLAIDEVRDCLATLEGKECVERSLGVGGHSAYITPKGRLELRRSMVVGDGTGRAAPGQIKIVPKGLRSFDEGDKDFFLQLLPGPFRNGLPESVHFWKARIEEADPEKSFRVGVIFGPSGCGKSSLVKAGLLPRLADHVAAVYVEATSDDTEARLLWGLRRAFPGLPGDAGLSESIASLRADRASRSGRTVVLLVDQFEQWLHARRDDADAELVAALGRCDGEHVRAILMVRDDFSMALLRFLKLLGIKLEEGTNFAVVDLFDPDHSRTVLFNYGQAFGKLADDPGGLNQDQKEFLDQSIQGLARDGLVVSVRLALFAEMVKNKPWTPKALREVGGTEGIGVTFLEETFGSQSTNPGHRLHQRAARAVLRALLPEGGTTIKGHMRSHGELLEASGYGGRPGEFADLLDILDGETRLITPTEPSESSEGGGAEGRPGEMYYQLTHDYLVPSVRQWLVRKGRETRRGRAELRLAECLARWITRPENRYLPSVSEWASIRLLTHPKGWSGPQRTMMKRADRVHGIRGALALALLLAVILAGVTVRQRMNEERDATLAAGLVDRVLDADISQVLGIVDSMQSYRRWVEPRLRMALERSAEDSPRRLHASLALLRRDAGQVDYLYRRLLVAKPDELPVLRDALKAHAQRLTPDLWTVVESSEADDARLLPAASALALYDPDCPDWERFGERIAQAMVAVNPIFVGAWIDALRPVRSKLTPSLVSIFRVESDRSLATSILAEYVQDKPVILADLLMDAEPRAFSTFFAIAETLRPRVVPIFQAEVLRRSGPSTNEEEKDRLASRQARAAVALVRMDSAEEVWPLLRHGTDPRLRSFLVNWLSALGAEARLIADGLDRIDPRARPSPAPGQQVMEAVLSHPETSMRRALILALGTYRTEGLSPAEREPLITRLLELYRDDPDAGIHGSAGWTLRRWGQGEKLKLADADLSKLRDVGRGDRRWYVNGQGQTFALIEGPVEFLMGSSPTHPDWNSNETSHGVVITRSFAIASSEVTVEQFRPFAATNPSEYGADAYLKRFSPGPDGPMIGMSWYIAAAYCNWLSDREGIPKGQWCYEPNSEGLYGQGMTIPADVLRRTGYRLPTEAEWEYACRAGATGSRYYGRSLDLLANYGWYYKNSGERARPCGSLLPSDLGGFDMLGNAYEWIQDRYKVYPEASPKSSNDAINTEEIIDENQRLLRGGTFYDQPSVVRASYRSRNAPSYRNFNSGCRLSRTYP